MADFGAIFTLRLPRPIEGPRGAGLRVTEWGALSFLGVGMTIALLARRRGEHKGTDCGNAEGNRGAIDLRLCEWQGGNFEG